MAIDMLEYPELSVLSKQMEQVLVGKTILTGKLVKYNNNLFMDAGEGEKYALLEGGTVTSIDLFAPELYLRLDNGYGILFGQGGGKLLYHADEAKMPENHTLHFSFTDGSALSYTMKLWSLGVRAVRWEEWEAGKQNADRFQPLAENTLSDFLAFLRQNEEQAAMPVKTFLAKYIAGVMSSFAAEILLYARVHPGKALGKLGEDERERLYTAMRRVLRDACEQGGRTSEVDLFGKSGGYQASAERKRIGAPCPVCGNPLEKVSVAGVTAYCPVCQVK